jgi:hypothetical protein
VHHAKLSTFRRGVVLPLDDRAEESLRSNDVEVNTRVKHLTIPDDGLFEKLWKTGIFHEINRRCSSQIDDYEEEFIEAPRIPDLTAAIETIAGETTQADLRAFLTELHKLTTAASMLGRPVLFVL